MDDRRVPPHSHEAEKAMIGIAVLDNSQVPALIPLVDPGDFYSDKTRALWEAVIILAVANKEVSIPALHEQLGGKMTMEEVARVIDGVPRSADAKYYAGIVREKSKMRKILAAATKLAGAAYDGDADEISTLITDLGSKKITGKRDHVLSEEVRHLVDVTSGDFSVTEIWNSLDYVKKRDKANIRQALHRLKLEGIIERSGRKDGVYRKVESDLEPMDFINAPTEGLVFDWPLNLHEICTIFPKDIICVAGTYNAGKSAFAVDFVRRNMDKHEIYYFNCEMSASRLKDRLLQVDDMAITDWKFHPYSRDDNFADVIRPNDVNIIDYLEVVEEHWLVAKRLKEIHNKLDQGIAIVMLQKPANRDTGMGGDKGLQKPNLYVAIDYDHAKLIKVKSWKGADNPNKKIVEFKLWHGWKFVPQGHWHSEEAGEAANKALGKFRIG